MILIQADDSKNDNYLLLNARWVNDEKCEDPSTLVLGIYKPSWHIDCIFIYETLIPTNGYFIQAMFYFKPTSSVSSSFNYISH